MNTSIIGIKNWDLLLHLITVRWLQVISAICFTWRLIRAFIYTDICTTMEIDIFKSYRCDCLYDLLTYWLPACLPDLLTGCLTDLMTAWLTYWLPEWLTDLLIACLPDWLTDCLTDWLTDLLKNWLTDCLPAWLTTCLPDWLTDWPTCLPNELPNDLTYTSHSSAEVVQ